MKQVVSRVGTLMLALAAVAAVHVGAPMAARGCQCCACDFGGGAVLCGTGDTDCGVCIADGGTPAATCSACDGESCDGGVLCAGDPHECSTDVAGGCCIDNELITGCFVMTAAACAQAELEGTYRGDGTNCDTPCPARNGSDCTMSSDCESTHCVDGVCCDNACTGDFQRCNLPDQLGVCVAVAAPAPILSIRGTIAAGLLLFGVAGLGLGRRRHRS